MSEEDTNSLESPILRVRQITLNGLYHSVSILSNNQQDDLRTLMTAAAEAFDYIIRREREGW